MTADPAEIARFAQAAPHWWEEEGEFATLHAINPVRLDYIRQQMNSLAGKKIIDVGCGGGILAESLARAGANVTGIDACEALLKVAQLHQMESGTTIDYHSISVEAMAEKQPEAFDCLTCLEVLEHVPDPAALIECCARLTKPRGDLFFSTLNRTPKAWLFAIACAEMLFHLLPRNTHDFKKFIRPAELGQWLRNAGLSIIDIKGLSYHPFSRKASLVNDLSVNYILHVRKL
jgi:2-polyprenyl-6-hydroxyphenyl methylase / 3-demethylubiquinone-9 3-methyltransferase